MFSEMHYNKIQIYVIKIFEMTHPHNKYSFFIYNLLIFNYKNSFL